MRFIALALGLALPLSAQTDNFSTTWYDGKAELSGYELTVSRYGEERAGTAVLIYVTETFDTLEYVKADRSGNNTTNALKLNLVRDFTTGIYDYNTMVSIFCRDFSLEPMKISFSSAEWCGHVYEEQILNSDNIQRQVHSYFQGESTTEVIPNKKTGILEDQLFILLRSLRGPYLKAGERITLPFLPGPYFSRLSHEDPKWTQVLIQRSEDTESITVPGGTFVSHRYTVEIESGRKGTFWIEDVYPHRILRWQLFPDVNAVLTGSKRLPYWKLNDIGHEHYLSDIGLR